MFVFDRKISASFFMSTGPTWRDSMDRQAVNRWPSLREIRNPHPVRSIDDQMLKKIRVNRIPSGWIACARYAIQRLDAHPPLPRRRVQTAGRKLKEFYRAMFVDERRAAVLKKVLP